MNGESLGANLTAEYLRFDLGYLQIPYLLRLAVYGNMKIDSGMIGIASTSTPDYWIPMIVNMNFTKPKRANHSKIFSLQETN